MLALPMLAHAQPMRLITSAKMATISHLDEICIVCNAIHRGRLAADV